MPKPMLLKLVRKDEQEEDRGEKAPVLLARPNRLAKRFGRASRGYALAGAGVVVGAVGFVSLLSWLAPDSDRPIGRPLEVVEWVAGGVLEQVDDQVAALLGTEGETVSRDVRENLTAVGSRIPWSGRVSEITPDRYSASSGPSTPIPTTRSTLNTPTEEEPSSSATDEPPPTTYAPSQVARIRRAARARHRRLRRSRSLLRRTSRHRHLLPRKSPLLIPWKNASLPRSNLRPQRSLPLHPQKSPLPQRSLP